MTVGSVQQPDFKQSSTLTPTQRVVAGDTTIPKPVVRGGYLPDAPMSSVAAKVSKILNGFFRGSSESAGVTSYGSHAKDQGYFGGKPPIHTRVATWFKGLFA